MHRKCSFALSVKLHGYYDHFNGHIILYTFNLCVNVCSMCHELSDITQPFIVRMLLYSCEKNIITIYACLTKRAPCVKLHNLIRRYTLMIV